MGTIKSERGKTIGGKIARLKLWGAKSHNWQTIGGKSAIKPNIKSPTSTLIDINNTSVCVIKLNFHFEITQFSFEVSISSINNLQTIQSSYLAEARQLNATKMQIKVKTK